MFNEVFAQSSQTVFEQQANTGSSLIQEWVITISLWGVAILIFILSFLFARLFKKIISYRLGNKYKYSIHQELLLLIERAIYFIVIMIGFFIGLSIARVDIQWVLGALSLGLGFAFKDLLGNIIAGVVILSQKKIKINDRVQVGSIIGTISSIDIRTTEVVDYDGNDHIIPNSTMLMDVVKNYTSRELRRICFEVGIHYDTPIKNAIDITNQIIKTHPQVVASPKPSTIAIEFGESAITLEVRFWIESQGNFPIIQSECIQLVKQAFDQANITIPFPIRTLNIDPHDKNIMKVVR